MGTGDIVGIMESQCDEKDWIVVRARQVIQPHLTGEREIVAQVPGQKHIEAFREALLLEGFQCTTVGTGALRAVKSNKAFYVYAKDNGQGIQGMHPTIRWDSTV